jgi:hypothetical protein
MKPYQITFCAAALCLVLPQLPAQDFGFGDFGFGDSDSGAENDAGGGDLGFGDFGSGGASSGSGFSVDIGGEIGFILTSKFSDYGKGWDANENFLSEIRQPGTLNAALDFSASSPIGDAVLNLTFNPQVTGESNIAIVALDEAYFKTFIGDFELEAGLRKLSWGKADANGVLDVINASDMSGSISLTSSGKANALLHGAYRLGQSKLEAVFVPIFQPAALPPGTGMQAPDTTTMDYFQTGLRFTTILGPLDVGAQYYYGYKPMPALVINAGGMELAYNRYHQAGVDAAFGFQGFNFRTELAANLTGDMSGDDPAVYNPNLAWHIGFDREIFWDMTAMVMASETITLLHDQIGAVDVEAGSKLTSTNIVLALSRSFLDDDLSVQLAGMIAIEDFGFAIMPGVSWSQGDFTASLNAGILGGADDSQFGALKDASFISVGMTYSF